MSTSLLVEMAEQKRWRLRPQWSHANWFDKLAVNEFLPADEQRRRLDSAVARISAFAASQSPYYRSIFERAGLRDGSIRSVDDLARIPVLEKAVLRNEPQSLKADNLPQGHEFGGARGSNGTTGAPAIVLHNTDSVRLFGLLKQREYRWFRFDPSRTFGMIRLPHRIPVQNDGAAIAAEMTLRASGWPDVNDYFDLGETVFCSVFNDIDWIVDWLDHYRPDYILSHPETLEQISFARPDPDSFRFVRGMEVISSQTTEDMRRRIELTFGAPLRQNYGLNEVGLMATECPEGHRYHVHTELCHVEIVDAEGQPCRPGERGRLLATNLVNTAMPLLRYDSDDLALAVEGPCPCGRTLPSFGEITPRRSKIDALPAGTFERVVALRAAVDATPRELSRVLRQFQIRQKSGDRFELRVVCAQPPEDGFFRHIRDAWKSIADANAGQLDIAVVDQIERAPGGKFDVFVSECGPGDR